MGSVSRAIKRRVQLLEGKRRKKPSKRKVMRLLRRSWKEQSR